jgi:hypothetical protein
MAEITETTRLEELAVIISEALERAGITATLSGGGAVSIYSRNQYMSYDLDFVTSASSHLLLQAIAPLGFAPSASKRLFEHPRTQWLVEFPPGPLGFGGRVIDHRSIEVLQTEYGALRVITPTLCVIDRLAGYWHWKDRQCWDQAVLICRTNAVDWTYIAEWAREEGLYPEEMERLRSVGEA